MRKGAIVVSCLTVGCVLLGLAAAIIFPDQTFGALTMARTFYNRIVSRMTPMPSNADRHIQEARIYEDLVREFFGSNRSNPIIFLRIAESDPSDELLARLKASSLDVRKVSEAHFDHGYDVSRVWTDRASGRRVAMIDIGSVSWVFGDTIEVKFGMSCGSLCGTGAIYRLVRSHGRWTVVGDRNRWVS